MESGWDPLGAGHPTPQGDFRSSLGENSIGPGLYRTSSLTDPHQTLERGVTEQIPRDLNAQADALANLGSAFNEPTLESIPIIHLTTSSIEAKEKVQMVEEVYNWSLDIWNYLKYDRLPDDKMEARKTRSKASRYTIFEGRLYR
ncbi:hypothetical protein OSB04_029183 [Centaurea solstitialis]|uniref:Uncharacterized protein n=1 Tax=Centaurea solstitialis TaxID=347529 RepID=A0AA38VYJ3_9ASTR|nr:hypothetical protein OSB04_029183 [Centaurea solstitialis]